MMYLAYLKKFRELIIILEDALNLLIELRNDARKRKDFVTSDKIRDELSKAGIILKDGHKKPLLLLNSEKKI